MAKTWLSVTVELLGGRGEELWPWPGRTFAVGPSHTFMSLADAINGAFARWDRAHLSMFTLADGRVVADAESGEEFAAMSVGPISMPLNIDTTKMGKVLGLGDEFQFTFDLGDEWTHRCTVGEKKVDPLDVLGIIPDGPLAYWGWGAIPDQYGRNWPDGSGQDAKPTRPKHPHPMLTHVWPEREVLGDVDVAELRGSIARKDVDAFLSAVTGRGIDDLLQQVGAGVPMALDQRRKAIEPVALSLVNRLTERGGAGDEVLADDLLALLRGQPLTGRVLSVDLDMVSYELEGDPSMSGGGYLDLETGEVIDEVLTDPDMVGEDEAIDMDEEPGRWLRIDRQGSRDGWRDMAAFADQQRDVQLRERLERAIEGKGAFARFRDVTEQENLVDRWRAFSNDRQMGRAREFLAGHGIRVG